MKPSSRGVLLYVTSAIILLPVPSRAEPVPLRRIVELALSHATGAAIAAADEQRAAGSGALNARPAADLLGRGENYGKAQAQRGIALRRRDGRLAFRATGPSTREL